MEGHVNKSPCYSRIFSAQKILKYFNSTENRNTSISTARSYNLAVLLRGFILFQYCSNGNGTN